MGDDNIKLTEAKDVRWLSYDAAVRALRRTYSSVIRSLETEAHDRKDAQALGLLTFCRKFEFVASLLLLSDIPPLANLSRAFQRKSLPFSDTRILVDGTKAAITALMQRKGTYLSQLDIKIKQLEDVGVQQPSERQKINFATKIEDPYLQSVVNNLDDRFPNTTLIAAFEIFSGTSLLQECKSPGYGEEEVELLARQFNPAVVNADDLLSEWRIWKASVQTDGTDLDEKNARQVAQMFAKSEALKVLYPDLYSLACVALVLPMSTVDCERGFSAVGRIKTKLRNRLSEYSPNHLMFISVEGTSFKEFGFADWARSKNRRLN